MVGGNNQEGDTCENDLPAESLSALLFLFVQNGPTQ